MGSHIQIPFAQIGAATSQGTLTLSTNQSGSANLYRIFSAGAVPLMSRYRHRPRKRAFYNFIK